MADELDRYYEILGLTPGASPEEVKQAYRDLAKVWHPDRFSEDDRLQQKAEEKLKDINKAYQRLNSHQLRSKAPHRSGCRSQQFAAWGGHEQWWRFQPTLDPPTPTRGSRSVKWRRAVAIGCAVILLSWSLHYLSGRDGPTPPMSETVSSANMQGEVSQAGRFRVPDSRDESFDQERKNERGERATLRGVPLSSRPRTALPLSAPWRYFTLGSTREEVMEIQGEPDHFSPDALQYGTSEVLLKDGRVVSWNNIYPRLKVRWLPATATTLSHFGLGSTKDEVLAIQGTPDRFTSDSFHYGTSDVVFQHGQVVGWNNRFPRLQVQMLPAHPTAATHFTLGSTKDEVLAIQGTPDRFTSDSFHYGTSDVVFQHGRVVGWRNVYPRLRVHGRPQEGLSPEAEKEQVSRDGSQPG